MSPKCNTCSSFFRQVQLKKRGMIALYHQLTHIHCDCVYIHCTTTLVAGMSAAATRQHGMYAADGLTLSCSWQRRACQSAWCRSPTVFHSISPTTPPSFPALSHITSVRPSSQTAADSSLSFINLTEFHGSLVELQSGFSPKRFYNLTTNGVSLHLPRNNMPMYLVRRDGKYLVCVSSASGSVYLY